MSETQRNRAIEYINADLPEFAIPEIRGERYQATVPDTLDLGERARHAVHALTATTDSDFNAEIYWVNGFGWKPPTMYHDANDWCEFKFYSASQLLRQACGSDEALDVEWHRMANLLQMRGPDDLIWMPLKGRPWGRCFGCEGDILNAGSGDHMIPAIFQGRFASIAGTYNWLTGERRWLELGDGIVGALERLATDRGDFAYFDKTIYAPGERRTNGPIPMPNVGYAGAWVGNGLMGYHRMTGSQHALDLAYKLARFFSLGHSGFVGPNGEFQTSHCGKSFETIATDHIHFHCNTHIRMLMLDAGLATGDKEMVELAQEGYAFGKDHGDTLMGYFSENVDADKVDPDAYGNTTEICEVAEMVYLALRQSTAGLADCWDDVDRWMRNMVAESQLLNTDWAYAFSEKHGHALSEDTVTGQPSEVLAHAVSRNVPERFRGAWGGWLWPNEWQGDLYRRSVMACCVGNMAMHFYRVWRDMVSYDEKKRRVSAHMLMNRATRWADLSSHIPYRGQVDVKVKQDGEIALRIPEWTAPADCHCTVNGKAIVPSQEGRYLVIPAARGDGVTLHCPIAERRETRTIMSKDYRVVVRGNEIVDIEPPGEHCPIFRRPHYRQDDTRWTTVDRFVSDRTFDAY